MVSHRVSKPMRLQLLLYLQSYSYRSYDYVLLMLFFLKSTRPFFYKADCTQQFESELSLRSLAPLFPIKKGSTSHPRSEGGNRPTRCSEPLRYKVVGPSKVFDTFCGMGPLGEKLST